jgi:2,3-bisphosphoglycerate-independent phosphoglycerate mutase
VVAPRASVDPAVPPAEALLGKPLTRFEPSVEQHAFAHRLAREVLDGHEINEVRRDLGDNGADGLWIWGPGGTPRLEPDFGGDRVSAFGTAQVWRGVCRVAGIPLRAPGARKASAFVRGIARALQRDRLCFVYARRGVRDALMREGRVRTQGVADLDAELVGPVAEAVAAAGGRLLVLPDAARDTATGAALPDPVPVLVWGEGIEALARRPFTEAGAAAAGDPIEPGHGLLAYVRHL